MRQRLEPGSPWTALTPINAVKCKHARWRIIEFSSVSGLPFRAKVVWSTGEDSGLEAQILVPRGTRLCVYAADLRIEVQNAADLVNAVICTVADGYAVTQNQYEYALEGVDGTAVEVGIPPFAAFVRVDCADNARFSAVLLRIYDGANNVRLMLTGPEQPFPGVPLGEARRITVVAPAGLQLRATFLLSL